MRFKWLSSWTLILCGIGLGVVCMAEEPERPEDAQLQPCLWTVTSIEAIQLSAIDDFAEGGVREAARLIAASFEGTETPPQSFYATVLIDASGTLAFELWHESAFEPAHCNATGNPGGLCRTISYNPETQTLSEPRFWQ